MRCIVHRSRTGISGSRRTSRFGLRHVSGRSIGTTGALGIAEGISEIGERLIHARLRRDLHARTRLIGKIDGRRILNIRQRKRRRTIGCRYLELRRIRQLHDRLSFGNYYFFWGRRDDIAPHDGLPFLRVAECHVVVNGGFGQCGINRINFSRTLCTIDYPNISRRLSRTTSRTGDCALRHYSAFCPDRPDCDTLSIERNVSDA